MKNSNTVLRYLSGTMADLIDEIDDYSSHLPLKERYKIKLCYIEDYFKGDNNIIEKCRELTIILKLISRLLGECKTKLQRQFASYIQGLTYDRSETGALCFVRHKHILFDDYQTMHTEDYEKITKRINKSFKDNDMMVVSALVADLDYISWLLRYKEHIVLWNYIDVARNHLIKCDDDETREHIISSNYLLYSVFKKDYEGDKELYNTFVKS